MSGYGLAGRRDNDGDRKAIEHTYEWKGEEARIKLIPPTVNEAEEYKNLGDEVDASEMADIVDKHIEKPSFDDAGDMTVEELQGFMAGIMDFSTGGDDVRADVEEELEKRNDDSAGGN